MNLITLQTNRLLLTGLSPKDISYIFNNLTKSQIKKILGHRSDEDYLKEEHKHKNGYSSYNRSFILFLITHKESGTIIGRCGLHNWNTEHKRAEIGYVMNDEKFKRKSLMTEAVNIIIDYGFKELKLNRIEAIVSTTNIHSLKIIEKYKFKTEGILRKHSQTNGIFEDDLLFSLLADDYLV